MLSGIFLAISAANAQITVNSTWFDNYEKIKCTSGSDKTFKFESDYWGEEGTTFSLTKTSDNHFSVSNCDDYDYLTKIRDVEYRVVEGHKLLLFKDAKGNILRHYENNKDDMWESEILKGCYHLLEGTYVDENGTKYTVSGNEFTIGGKKLNFRLDNPQQYYIIDLSDGSQYWWMVSTTGINIYHIKDNGYGGEPGDVWHKLKDISSNGRWEFLSREIVSSNILWMYPSGMIRIMRNEIFARHGYVFNSTDLKEYFGKQPWYKPLNNNAAVKLSAIETLNSEILKANETAAREGSDDPEIEEGLK